jgi:hypothetical protein
MWTIFSIRRHLTFEITRIFTAIKTRVMITKLTLTLNQEVIDSAKAYAKRNGKSLSAIVENYLRSLDRESEKKEALAPEVKRLLGSVKLSKDSDYKKDLQAAIINKYSS